MNSRDGEDLPSGERPDMGDPDESGNANALFGRWTHAHEEDTPGRMVYRPADSPLPPSRGRVTLEFGAGGRVSVNSPGPDDRRSGSEGQWTLVGSHLSVTAPGWSGEFEVIEVSGDKLVLAPA